MVDQMPPGQKMSARIAGVIVLLALIFGGYYFFMLRPSLNSGNSPTGTGMTATSTDNAAKSGSETAAAPAPAANSTEASAPPAAATGAAPDGKAPAGSSFDVVRVEPTGEGVIAGLSEPNATIEILDGSGAIASGQANERGEWAIVLDKPLAPGTHDLSIRTTSADKKTETLSEQHVAIEVPTGKGEPLVVLNDPNTASRVLQVPAKPDAPRIAAATPAAGEPGAAAPTPAPSTDASTPATPAPQPRDNQVATAQAPSPAPAGDASAPAATPQPASLGKVTIDAVEYQDGKVYVAGSASLPGTIRLYVDGDALGDATPAANGRWLLERKHELTPGRHLVRADQVEKATGKVLVRVEVPFEQTLDVAQLAPITTEGGGSSGADATGAVPGPQNVIIRRGDNLWTISRRLYGHGVRFSTIYEANAEQIKDPNRIYPGQVFVLPAGDARWTN